MKKILILLSAILLIASTFALGISADPYDEVQLPGLPEGVQGYEIEGASNENYPDLFEVTKKYFIVSMTLPFAEKVGGTLGDNGCVGLTIGNENYECFYIPHDVVDYHNGTRSPGFSEDPRAQIRVGAWWTSPAFGSYQTNYLDGQDGSITEDTLVGQDITIYVEGKVEFEDEASEAWKVTIKAWINDTPLVLNGGEMEVTAYDFDANPYVGYGCKLTGVTAQIKFAQSNKEIDRSVLVNGVPDDTGFPGIEGSNHIYDDPPIDQPLITAIPETTKYPSVRPSTTPKSPWTPPQTKPSTTVATNKNYSTTDENYPKTVQSDDEGSIIPGIDPSTTTKRKKKTTNDDQSDFSQSETISSAFFLGVFVGVSAMVVLTAIVTAVVIVVKKKKK